MTTLQRRRLYFGLGLLAACLSLFLFIPWQAALTLLVLLAILLSGGPLRELWHLIRDWKPASPEYQPSHSQEEEYSSYQEGLKEHPVLYRRPYNVVYVPSSDTPGQPKEESLSELEPQAQYPQQMQ